MLELSYIECIYTMNIALIDYVYVKISFKEKSIVVIFIIINTVNNSIILNNSMI